MRSSYTSLLGSLVVVAFLGCSSSDSPPADPGTDTGGGGTDSSATDSTPSDSSGTDTSGGGDTKPATDTGGTTTDASDTGSGGDAKGVTCGTTTCTGTDICCATPSAGGTVDYACAATCGDGGVPISCDGPEDCASSAKYCCGTIETTAGTPPSCFKAGSAECKATCNTKIVTSCSSKGTVRLCHTGSDCADDTANPNCCEFAYGTTSATFCVDNTTKLFAAGCKT
jgi:hypothetical protein